MCLIALNVDKKMSYGNLKKAWEANSHGAGFIWMNKDKKAQYIKGIETLEELYELVQNTELPFVIHLRVASVGGINPFLTQPFEITEKSELRLEGEANRVLVHNGTEQQWKMCLAAAGFRLPRDKDGKEEPISDSRAIAMILSRHKNNDFLHIASGRFVVIGHSFEGDENAFRFFGEFSEEDGIFYSNNNWKYGKTFTGLTYNETNYYSNHYNHRSVHTPALSVATTTPVVVPEVKKKDEDFLSDNIPPLKSFRFFTRRERLVYRRWWKVKEYECRLGLPIVNPIVIDIHPAVEEEKKGTQVVEEAENGELMIAHMF
jgi:hypothetical protein